MGKNESWFSAIKSVFTRNSKKQTDGSDTKSSKEKKRRKGLLRRGDTRSFLPIFREPSSIEKILGEADQLLIKPGASLERPRTSPPRSLHIRPVSPQGSSPRPFPPRVLSPKARSPKAFTSGAASPRPQSPRVPSPKPPAPKATGSSKAAVSKITESRKGIDNVKRPEPTSGNQQVAANAIQAAFRGYMARRSFRAVKGLVRLQGVMKGQNVKRQTMNAMKQMQLLVRVQSQIHSRRIQMLEYQMLQPRMHGNDKEAESTASKWTSGAGQNENWDDSFLTKEDADAQLRKKAEAVIKRERAMAYAYSHRLWKASPKSSKSTLDVQSNGNPWWWNWLDRQLRQDGTSHGQATTRNVVATPPRSISGYKPSPRNHSPNFRQSNITPDNRESITPRSSRSPIPFQARQFRTPSRTSPAHTSSFSKFLKPRAGAASSAHGTPLKDDDSLVSCPPFSAVPNYMTPTVSTKAKVRANSNPRERFPGTPGSESKRRFSFPLMPNVGSFKGSNRDSSQMPLDKRSIGERSVDSTVSMPALVGRKPFNRFV